MKRSLAISWLKAAKRHIDGNECYRWWALYSACLVTFMYWTCRWPWSVDGVYAVYHVYPSLLCFLGLPWDAGVYLVWSLALVGLVRSSWVGRGLAVYSIQQIHFLQTDRYWDPLGWLWGEFTWYAFDLPGKWIRDYAGEGTALSTCLWFVYMLLVWIALRPLLKQAYPGVRWLGNWITNRWPQVRRLARPVI